MAFRVSVLYMGLFVAIMITQKSQMRTITLNQINGGEVGVYAGRPSIIVKFALINMMYGVLGAFELFTTRLPTSLENIKL